MPEIDELTLLGLNQGRTLKASNRMRILLKWVCIYLMCLVGGASLGLVAGLVHDWRIG